MSFLSPPPSSLFPAVLASEPITRTFCPSEAAAGLWSEIPSAPKVSMLPLSLRYAQPAPAVTSTSSDTAAASTIRIRVRPDRRSLAAPPVPRRVVVAAR